MTDKQIVIDGVDIKDCKRRIGKDNFCRYYKRPCAENNYNCIWKKYLRKEQECERLKLDLIEARAHGDYLNNSALSETLKIVSEQCDQLKAKNIKISKTLIEIKEIAEKLKNFYEELGKCEDLTVVRLKQILQKISEVSNDWPTRHTIYINNSLDFD